jgi:hypothetical protein
MNKFTPKQIKRAQFLMALDKLCSDFDLDIMLAENGCDIKFCDFETEQVYMTYEPQFTCLKEAIYHAQGEIPE